MSSSRSSSTRRVCDPISWSSTATSARRSRRRPNYTFGEDDALRNASRAVRWLRSAAADPLLKLLFNPNPLIEALHIQAELNTRNAERAKLDALHYELIHNLVVELTRTGVEVKSLKMRLESMASRLDFDERRARALEGVVQYRSGVVPPQPPPTGQDQSHGQGRREQSGRRDQRTEDQRPYQQGRRDQRGPGPSGPGGFQAPGSPAPGSPVPLSAVAGSVAAGGSPVAGGAPIGGAEANALDADGNERRARRRRRRGRRRPGFDDPRTEDRGSRSWR